MIDNHTIQILSSILRVMAATREPAEINARVSAELLENGFSPVEVTEALRLLESLMEGLPTSENFDAPLLSKELRAPHPREAMKLSDEAVDLFDGWRKAHLLTPEENEAILSRILDAGVGEIEPDELKRIAVEASRQGSLLALYLSDPASAAN